MAVISPTDNVDEIKSLSRSILIGELVEKTINCAVIWKQIGVGQYTAALSPFDFYLSTTGQGTYTLDVLKSAKLYRSYNSITQTEVSDLFMTVDTMLNGMQGFDRLRSTVAAISQFPSCIKPRTQSITSICSVIGGGAAFVYTGITLVPTAISSTGLTSGTIDDIDEPVDAEDGDASTVVIDYTGVQNPDYMLVKVEFDQSQLPVAGTYNMIRGRVVCKADSVDDINMVLDYSINNPSAASGLGYAGFTDITNSYATVDSGFSNLPSTMTQADFTTPLVLWFYIIPQAVGHGSIEITSVDLTLAKN